MNIYLDIETIPTSRPEVRERIADTIVPKHSNGHVITDEKKAAAWWAEHGAKAIVQEVSRTALDGGLGEVVCICAAVDDEEIETFFRRPEDGPKESVVLDLFFNWARTFQSSGTRPHFIGANIADFDLRFLWKRAVVLGVRPKVHLPHADKPWKDTYTDVLELWYGGSRRQKGERLVAICEALSINVDDDIDGSEVWERWKAGDIDAIVQHCRADVERTRECYLRMMFL